VDYVASIVQPRTLPATCTSSHIHYTFPSLSLKPKNEVRVIPNFRLVRRLCRIGAEYRHWVSSPQHAHHTWKEYNSTSHTTSKNSAELCRACIGANIKRTFAGLPAELHKRWDGDLDAAVFPKCHLP
jgi:hypothetical protein